MRCKFVAALFFVCSLFPALSQEQEEDFDDFLPIEDEGEITIVGTKETHQQMRRVDRETIEETHAPDLPVLLETTLGLGTTRYGPYGSQADVNIRGFDTERLAVLIDGVPVNNPSDGDFDFSRIDPESVESIEVIYGGSDSKFNVSGALGGVVNIITVKKQKPGLRFGGGVSNTSTIPGKHYSWKNKPSNPRWEDLADAQKLNFFINQGFKTFSWSFSAFGNRAGNHFVFEDNYETTRRKEGNEILDTGAQASLVWGFSDYSKLIFSGDIYYGDKNFPTGPNTNIAADQEDFSSRQNIMLDMPRAFHDNLAMEASFSHYGQTLDYREPGTSGSSHDQHSFTLINRWSWYPHSAITLRFGGDYRYAIMDSTDTGQNYRGDGGIYTTAEYQIHPKLLIVPSVKLVAAGRPGTSPQFVPVPKLGLVWTPLDELIIKNNYFRSFKIPDFVDLYWKGGGGIGNPNLKSEDGWGADLGFTYRFPKWLELESVFFAQRTLDSIHWSNSSGTWRPENVGEAVFFGSDSRVSGIFPFTKGPFQKASVSLSYQYLLSYLLSYGYNYDSDKRIPYMPAHHFSLSTGLYWKSGSFFVTGRYESLRYADTANLSELDPHFLLDLTVNQNIGKNFSAFTVVRNALNTSYQSFKDYPMPGITVTVGIKTRFEYKTEEP
jgi:outer membrane cobalamin receptor